jgi:glycerol-3-phosphate dehydrogenase
MQFRITRLACRERDRMLTLSPHLVEPIRFLYPAYRGDRTPGWQVDFGLWMYDRLTGRPDRHAQLDLEELERLVPGLDTRDLDRALAYTDAMADDARLTLAVAATAHAYGTHLLTRCEVTGADRSSRGRVRGAALHDLEDGSTHHVAAQVVVNATGVWTDAVRERLGLTGSRLRPSRGAHVILARNRLKIAAAVTLLSPDDGRPVFLIPHAEGILVGTTDIYHEGGLDDPRPTSDEVGYLLRAAASAFPDDPPTREDVRGAFAGLRPILDTHAEDPSEASREEDIWEEDGVLSVAGGKLTTWRSTAEEAVDAVLKLLPEERVRRASPCATKGTALAGLAPPDLGDRLAGAFSIDREVARGMARRLGALAWSTAAAERRGAGLRPLEGGCDLCAAEVQAHLRWGAALHLEDLLLRRVRLGMWHPELATALLRKLRPVVRGELGWSWKQWRAEEERFREALEAWTLSGVR